MQGKLTLVNPIKIDGKNVKQIKYDTNEITPVLFAEAETRKANAGHGNGNRSGAMELDYPLHLYLGFAAVLAVNEGYTFEDLERVKGRDIIEISVIGRNFIMKSEGSEGETSDEQSETSPESTTQA